MTGSGNAWTALGTGAGFVGWTAAWKLGLLAGLDALAPPSADAAGHAWAVAVAVVLRPLWVYVALGAWGLWWWFRGAAPRRWRSASASCWAGWPRAD
ncbi:MAG: hypothetical protein HZY73_01370 [Micropruina sp.]|nr:MAG: hypothetical protein HZY73_01370 [Micropruina sp.]